MWEHYFKGDDSSIWNWAKNHMWHKSGSWDGYFAWKRGETGANAVATYALMNNTKYAEAVKKNLQMAWDAKPMTGQYRYYDGLVHYISMLHLCGSFKIWKPKPEITDKEVNASEYNGVKITKDTTFHTFESCKLYKVIATPGASKDTTSKDTTSKDSTDAIRSAMKYNSNVRVWSTNHAIVIENAPIGAKYAVTDLNGRMLASSKTTSAMQEIKLDCKGRLLVIVGSRTYKIVK